MRDVDEYKNQKGADAAAEQQMKNTLVNDCDWVKTHFGARREKRKTEMDGLWKGTNGVNANGVPAKCYACLTEIPYALNSLLLQRPH